MKKFHVCVLLVSTALLLMTQPFSQAGEKQNAVEKFTVESIEFDSGEKKRSFKDKKLLEKLEFEIGDDVIWAEPGRDNLENFYHAKGFAFAQIALKTEQLPDGKIKLTYKIDEGPKVSIGKIYFRGNNTLKSEALKPALKSTGKKWFFWSKSYLRQELTRDLNKLKGIYWNKGFLAHTISYSLSPDILDPAVIVQERKRQKCKINITFEIEEGPVYTVEKIILKFIDLAGKTTEEIVLKSTNPQDQQAHTENQTFNEKQLRARVELEPAQIYSERTAFSDAEQLRMLYGVNGFINARIKLLRPVFIPDTHAVNIEFQIFEGRQYQIGRIDITGNKEAQDKVIRRILDEYDFFPAHLYNAGIAPKEGGGELEKKIQRMTLAEEVTITPMGQAYGPKDTKVLGQDAEVNIKEGLTGNIWPGVGVSSDHGFIGQLIYDERNFDITDWPESTEELIPGRSFRGAGQSFKIGAEPGTRLSQYTVSFGDPYWGGEPNKPIRLGVTGSSWERIRESYEEGRIKGYVGFEKRYNHGLWFRSISFRAEEVDVGDIDADTPIEITSIEGGNFIAGIKVGIERNSTDDEFFPSMGSIFDISYEQVGGDHSFGILKGAQRWYRTLHEDLAERKTIMAIKILGATTINDAPPFEKFYGGGTGIYSMRGFDYRGVSTRGINPISLERDDPIGSDWIFLANAEVTVPLTGESFAALFFIDSGTIDSGGYRAAVGTGIQIMIPQWFGPVPMRFEIAAPILKDDEDDTQAFSFSVGKMF
jgi:outer membrane protein insertion porin family